MQTTLELDGRLLDRARFITGIKERTALIHAGLMALIERANAPLNVSAPGAGGGQAEYTGEKKPIQFCTEAEKRQRIQAFLEFTAREAFPVDKVDIPSREERNAR